jgi:predicted CXXCH cytochrome family protein
LICHAQPDQSIPLPDGSMLDISVDPEGIEHSVHGELGLGCIDCHGEDAFPHDDPLPPSARVFTIEMASICTDCHTAQANELIDSVHASALTGGNLRAATCVDCHGAHEVQPPDNPPVIAQTCGACHQFVFGEFETSVHGESLLAGDPNVPTCTNCHGVHGIEHPTTALFRNRSPELCAECHADEDMMAEYDITTNVFDSYLSDFHGTTVALFAQQDPNVASSQAVCFDCHGVHDIKRVDAENSRVVRENLLETCQSCHPDATSDFPDSWVGHYPPTLDSHPLLFTVNAFYTILIPTVLGGFLLFVASDIFRRVHERARRS